MLRATVRATVDHSVDYASCLPLSSLLGLHVGQIGEDGYIRNLRQRYGFSLQDAWICCAAGGLRRYQAMTHAQLAPILAHFNAVPNGSHALNRAAARAWNPNLP